MKCFRTSVILLVLASAVVVQSDEEMEMNEVEHVFETHDVNKDGKLTWEELSTGPDAQNMPETLKIKYHELFKAHDTDGDGFFDSKELEAFIEASGGPEFKTGGVGRDEM
eukprot:gb/GFBE01000755.1/.p1 GENE.gb/GFBE01000755.1/~~gb/GFBE01000755.1/.p1  ORF type:complete len:110 (+),score=32.55 gb/GFBE01000755.1/:1-330(+)